MKAFVLRGIISLTIVLSVFDSVPANAHEDLRRKGTVVLFTKHFQESLFDVTEHGKYSIEVLLDDKEYKIGENVIGIVVHDADDKDVVGAELVIVHKNLATSEIAPGKLTLTDKKNGLYTVSGLDLKRAGKWELLITVKKAGIEDRVKFVFPDALKERVPKGRYSP